MRILSEFREFALKGNVVDMAVGIIIGGGEAFAAQAGRVGHSNAEQVDAQHLQDVRRRNAAELRPAA